MITNKEMEILKEVKNQSARVSNRRRILYCCVCGKKIEDINTTNRHLFCKDCLKKNQEITRANTYIRKKCRNLVKQTGELFHEVFQKGDVLPCYQCGSMIVFDGEIEHLVCPRCRVNSVKKNKNYVSFDPNLGFLFHQDHNKPFGKIQAKRAFEAIQKRNLTENDFVKEINRFLAGVIVSYWSGFQGFSLGDPCYCNLCGAKTVYQGAFVNSLCEKCKEEKLQKNNKKTVIQSRKPNTITREFMSEDTVQKLKEAAEENHFSFTGLCRMIIKDYELEESES